ncbi:capsular biosynthesis protein [Sphingomonas ginsenosidivorax]|uniref:Capsular biosynthesis protein n=2 Tax=Sphingomonas ginsenosidivorax TaxID=862135 RepID=A0A5C6UAD1_9SPHN|nr:capsular biosynthesis protein [Sphingomonas ginsenosidivorax]
MVERQVFGFLQGPHGDFFRRLAARLRAEGHTVHRINLNGGDRHDWQDAATDYTGTLVEWPEFFGRFVNQRAITDIVLYGDCRPHHRSAHIVASMRGIRVWVYEEGYIRPDFMTLELEGVNGHSMLSTDPDWYRAQAQDLPLSTKQPPVPSDFSKRVHTTIVYYLKSHLNGWRFPGYRTHRTEPAYAEAWAYLREYLDRPRRARRIAEQLKRFAAIGSGRHFVLPLQLNSDYQLRVHSHYPGMSSAAFATIESFARAGPADSILVIKRHPLDTGVIDWRRILRGQAEANGVGDRVLYLEGGDIAQIIEGALGVVTINSTVGTLSLGAGVPTYVLGRALYGIEGLVHSGSLDSFWQAPTIPDPVLWDAFTRVLRDRCLVAGGLSSDQGVEMVIEGSVARLTGANIPITLKAAAE